MQAKTRSLLAYFVDNCARGKAAYVTVQVLVVVNVCGSLASQKTLSKSQQHELR